MSFALFQSLIGILVHCNSEIENMEEALEVSIPNRDFSSLQFENMEGTLPDVVAFQSLIGILVHCNLPLWIFNLLSELFQSLIGILVHCNDPDLLTKVSPVEFQSLIGILVHCNCTDLKALIYLVFKVQLRQPPIKVAFGTLSCQGCHQKNKLKSLPSKD